MARAKRQATAGDMVRSLAVLLIPVLLITWFFTNNLPDHPVRAVEWRPAYTQAQREASFDVVAPQRLPQDWTPTQVRWENPDSGGAQRWLSGWLDPQRTYLAVEQSTAPQAAFLPRVTRDGVPDGRSQVSKVTWQRYRSGDERTRSLVRTDAKATTVVVGDTSYEALEAFAATLG